MPILTRPVTDERDGLLAYIASQRAGLKASVFGLTREQATSRPSGCASELNLAGLIKHVTMTERNWVANHLGGRVVEIDYENGFHLTDDETVEGILAAYDAVAAETEEIVRGLPNLEVPVPVPDAPWFPKDVEAWDARWVLLHVIEETARHLGHADIIRESIDGANAFVNQMAAEGETPEWLEQVTSR